MLKPLQWSSFTHAGQTGQWNQHEKWAYETISLKAIYTFQMLKALSFDFLKETWQYR